MKAQPKPTATFADLDRVPDTMVGQLIDGDLLVLPRPALPHAQTTSNAGADINGYFGRSRPPGGWWILDEPELRLGADALVPDLAGWRRGRLPTVPAEPFLTLPPDWVLEVLSPSTASFDRVLKARIYAREGVPWLWFIDPLARTIEVNRLESGNWLRVGAFAAGEALRAEPFDAVEFDTADWFAETPAGP
jgi:Uma2 family endonuclease